MTYATQILTDQVATTDTFPDTVDTLPIPVGARDYKAQREWERHQITRGVERYRASLQKVHEDGSIRRRSLTELEPGQVIAQDLIEPLTERVKAAQADYLKAYEDPRLKRVPEASWPLTALPPERLAACAALTALARPEAASFTAVGRDCGTRVMHEIEYEAWKAAEATAAKERRDQAKAGKDAPFVPDLFRLMLRRNSVVDLRVFKKWTNKAPHFVKGEWTQEMKFHVGSVLMTLLVESSTWFRVDNEWGEGKNQRKLVFSMSDEGRAFVAHRHTQNELMRPFLLPMIAEPLDYEYPPEPEEAPASIVSLADN